MASPPLNATLKKKRPEALPSLEELDIRRSLTRLIALSLAITMLVAIGLAIEVDRNRLQGQWVFHSTAVISSLENARIEASDHFSALKTFLLTGDTAMVGYMRGQEALVNRHLLDLHTLVADNANQTRRMDSVASLYWQWEVSIDELVRLRNRDHDSSATFVAEFNRVRTQFKSVRDRFETTIDAETMLREHRLQMYQNGSRGILYSVIGACLLLGLFGAIFGRRQIRRIYREFGRALRLATRTRDQLRIAFMNIGDAVIMTDRAGAIQLMSPKAEALTGWRERDAIDKQFDQVVSFVTESELRSNAVAPRQLPNPVDHAIGENRTITMPSDTRLVNRKGIHVPVEAAATPIVADRNDRVGAVVVLRDISQRRDREAELFRREQEFRALVEHSPDLIIRFDRDFRITFINSRAEDLLNLSSRQVVGKTFNELGVSEERQREWERAIEQAKRTGVTGTMETSFTTVRGVQYFHARFVPEIDEKGNITSIISTARDITESRKAERELRASEAQFRAVVEYGLDAFYLLEAVREHGAIVDFKFVYINENGAHLTTFSKRAMMGKRLLELMPGERTVAYIAKCATVVETGVPVVEEYMARSSYLSNEHGEVVWLHSQFVKVDDRVAITTTDITERKRMERSLRDSEERYRRVVESAPEAIFSTDDQGRITYANPFICSLSGYTPEDVIGISYLEFVEPGTRTSVKRFFFRQLTDRQTTANAEFPFLSKTGEIRWLALTSRLRLTENKVDGDLLGFDIIGIDVTESRLERERLRKMVLEAGME